MGRVVRSLGDIGLGGRICTKEPGYEIRIEEDELDLTAFEREVVAGIEAAGDGSSADCVLYLRRALALWHGEPRTFLSVPGRFQGLFAA
ncbi:BTAD domain-containing putative transcriptional regulator [Streptomyces sp. CA-278952]|uniref:BTAD domain-containing putative transcriptional regulator n=1 Tax=unclassified Streptomyces TaxID=2593676 RepID=UPI0023684A0C|nr:BTAD domain-containing putative transcriptional regulator [Streptomyces sp. CA-278952]WDG28505.1 BTAD domain-containing putative transcriptional regulator [Streptomyces sp. CA-278952]